MEKETISNAIKNSVEVKNKILGDDNMSAVMERIADEIQVAFKNEKKVLFCGNGGSAADAQHLAAELSGKLYINREPLYAEALHCNTSYLTAAANDYSFEDVYERLIRAQGKTGDILVGISTSGNSKNVVKAIETANQKGIITVGFTGGEGGKMKELCQYLINVPSNDAPRIQESHILIGHIICELAEKKIFSV